MTIRRACLFTAAAVLALFGAATAPAAAAQAPAAHISAVKAASGSLKFLVSVQGLPAGETLDPKSVQVDVGGTGLTAAAAGVSGDSGAAPTRAVFMLLDTSGSMAGARIAAAKSAAAAYVKGLPSDVRVGLIAFSAQPHLLLQPTSDDAAFVAALANVQTGGETALYDAADTAIRAFATAGYDATSDRRLLVLSDGEDTASKTSLDSLAGELTSARIPTDVVAIASGTPSTALGRIASASGGQTIATGNTAGVAAAFQLSARTVADQLLVTATVPAGLAGQSATVTVHLASGTAKFSASAPVVLAADAAAVSSRPTLRAAPVPPAPTGTGWFTAVGLWLALGLCFAAIFTGFTVVLSPAGERARRLAQLAAYGQQDKSAPSVSTTDLRPTALARSAVALTEQAITARGLGDRIAAQLDRAGLSISAPEWVLLRACASAASSALLVLLTGNLLGGVLIGTVIGWLGTWGFIVVRTSRRCARFADRLPDALQLVASSLKSGFSLPQSLDALVKQSAPPLGPEFGRAVAEARIGVPIEDALTKVADRMDSQDLRWTVMTIRIQREVGGNLAEVLVTTAETMRERARVRRHVRALSAEGRLSAYVLVALPICVGAWMFLTRASYLRPLYTEPIGIAMLVVSVLLTVVGWFWMLKLAKVEV